MSSEPPARRSEAPIEGPWYPLQVANVTSLPAAFGDEVLASIPLRSPLYPNLYYTDPAVPGAIRGYAFAFTPAVAPFCRETPVACLDIAARSRFLPLGAQPILGSRRL